jgi:hypothetical protein
MNSSRPQISLREILRISKSSPRRSTINYEFYQIFYLKKITGYPNGNGKQVSVGTDDVILTRETCIPCPQSGPAAAPDYLSGHHFSGITCKNHLIPAHFS